MIIPNLEAYQLFCLLGDVEKRMKIDPRWVNPKLLEVKGNFSIVYHESPKPPFPLVSAREVICESYSEENGDGPEQHLFLQMSTDHPE